jgi:hypothetical protein
MLARQEPEDTDVIVLWHGAIWRTHPERTLLDPYGRDRRPDPTLDRVKPGNLGTQTTVKAAARG